MELGTVISTIETPTTGRFAFVIADPKKVRKGTFVELDAEDGLVIGVVQDIVRSNRYFERAESISEYEKTSSFRENFPTSEWEYAVADCAILGAFDGALKRSSFPPAPGSKVRVIKEDVLRDFLGFESGGLKLGSVLQATTEARVNASSLLQKHFALLGMSGSGKSVTASVIIEELLSRDRGQGRPAVVVFDVHGEYSCFANKRNNPAFADKTVVIDCEKVRIGAGKLTDGFLARLLSDVTPQQLRDLAPIRQELRKRAHDGGEPYTLEELVSAVIASEMKENSKQALVSWLSDLQRMDLIGKVDSPQVNGLLKPGKLVVFDFSQVIDLRRKQAIVAYYAETLFRMRRKGEVPPFLLVVEEAHNFCKEKAEKRGMISKYIIETIAREGRKFHASLCLVSQRPVQLSTTALSQCNTTIIMRITNPYDLKHVSESCESIDSGTMGAITTLKVGEGVVIGEAVNYPCFVKVRNRLTRKSEKAEGIEEASRRYEEEQMLAETVKEEDLDAFL